MPIIAGNTITKTPSGLATNRRAPDAGYTGLGLNGQVWGARGAAIANAARGYDLPIRREGDLLRRRLGDIDDRRKFLQAAVKGVTDAFQIWGRAQERYDERWATQQATEYARRMQQAWTGGPEAPGIRESVVQLGKDGPENGAAQNLAKKQQDIYDELTRDADVDSYARRVFDDKVARTNDHYNAEAASIDRQRIVERNRKIDADELAQKVSEAMAASDETAPAAILHAAVLAARNQMDIPRDAVRRADGSAFDWDNPSFIVAEDGTQTPDIVFPDEESAQLFSSALAKANDKIARDRLDVQLEAFANDQSLGPGASAEDNAAISTSLGMFYDPAARMDAEAAVKKTQQARERREKQWAGEAAQAYETAQMLHFLDPENHAAPMGGAYLDPDAMAILDAKDAERRERKAKADEAEELRKEAKAEDEYARKRTSDFMADPLAGADNAEYPYLTPEDKARLDAKAYRNAATMAYATASKEISQHVEAMRQTGASMEAILQNDAEVKRLIDSVKFPEYRERLLKEWQYGPVALKKAVDGDPAKAMPRAQVDLLLDTERPVALPDGTRTSAKWSGNAEKVEWLAEKTKNGEIAPKDFHSIIEKMRTEADKTDENEQIAAMLDRMGVPIKKILDAGFKPDETKTGKRYLSTITGTSPAESYWRQMLKGRFVPSEDPVERPFVFEYEFLVKLFDYARKVTNDIESGVAKGDAESIIQDYLSKSVEYRNLTDQQLLDTIVSARDSWDNDVEEPITALSLKDYIQP